ncbi:MAG TPA: sigma-70 family RNA polymerase sigma factor [Polyangiaceae bacterium]
MLRAERPALGELYSRHGARMLALARHVVGNDRDAEDVLHEVFLEVWQRAGDYDPERGSVLAWLLVRIRSRSLDRLRVQKRSKLAPDESRVPEPTAPLGAQDAFVLRDAIARLSPELRELVELGYYAGMTSVEIAQHVKLPVGTVKSRVARALATLRATLGSVPAHGPVERDDDPDSSSA